jgi:hypothetical protein
MKFDCKDNQPHSYQLLFDGLDIQVEQCDICNKKIRFNKDKRGRVDNKQYLEAHIRELCQPHGRTAKIYYRIYHPELYEQNKHIWTLNICDCKDVCIHHRTKKQAYIGDLRRKGTNEV